jgi:hypothetical protein
MGLEAGLRGIDLDAFCREAPVWRFGPGRADVVGCDVRINLRALAARLGQSELLAAGNAARVGAALAQRLLKSFLHLPAGARYRHFVHVPADLLALPDTWALLEELPAASRSLLVLSLELNPARQQDLAAQAGMLAEIGVSLCLAGVDFAVRPSAPLPAGVAWLRGPVTPALDPLAAEAVLATLVPAQLIADVGEDAAALQVALEVGFLHAAGPAAEAAAHRPPGGAARPGPHRPDWRPAAS